MKTWFLPLIGLLTLQTGCSILCIGPVPVGDSLKKETEDIAEIVIRHVMKDSYVSPGNPVFLSIEGKDPGPEFVKRFSDQSPPFMGLDEKKNYKGKVQEFFGIANLTWNSGYCVEVWGGEGMNDPKESSPYFSTTIYTLKKRLWGWVIVSHESGPMT